MGNVFIYWDNSNIFISAQQVAIEREGADVRQRVPVWNRLENEGVGVQLLERGLLENREQGVDQTLQTAMLRDAFDYNGKPGTAVMLTGDGSGFHDGVGFHADMERMHKRGWKIEVLSWQHSCNRRMRKWAERKGKFIALDDFHESITVLEPPLHRVSLLPLPVKPFRSTCKNVFETPACDVLAR